MAAVVRTVHPHMTKAGFRKRRHAFNRSMEDGVVQVVNFQMGPNEQFGDYSAQAMRHGLYGEFTVNLGVWTEEVALLRAGSPPRPFVSTVGFPHPWTRLGQLLEGRDVWWPLVGDLVERGEQIVAVLESHALPWLEGLGTRERLISAWRRGDWQTRLWIWDSTYPLTVATVLARQGDRGAARALLDGYLRETRAQGDNRHAGHVIQLANSMGFDLR